MSEAGIRCVDMVLMGWVRPVCGDALLNKPTLARLDTRIRSEGSTLV